jgi:hypothetical protein
VLRFPTEGVRLPFREQLEGGALRATAWVTERVVAGVVSLDADAAR